MMFRLALLGITLTLVSATLEGDWAVFKHQHGKQYETRDEEIVRKAIFQENLKDIKEHNERYASGLTTYYKGVNKFSDMTAEEWRARVNGLMMNQRPMAESHSGTTVDVSSLPDTVDWRKEGYVTPVKNQGYCGSCWAFSATGALEGQYFKATGDLIGLSESQLVDCSWDWGNEGCDGGLMTWAYDYIRDVNGIESEETYPYVPKENDCYFDIKTVVTAISSYVNVTSGSEPDLQKAVAEIGPIAVAIDAGQPSFRDYQGGVYDEPNCNNIWEKLNHAVLAVGYGSEGGQDYWIVKNSWSDNWGDKGYILMSRNKDNQCGIATAAVYPVLK